MQFKLVDRWTDTAQDHLDAIFAFIAVLHGARNVLWSGEEQD